MDTLQRGEKETTLHYLPPPTPPHTLPPPPSQYLILTRARCFYPSHATFAAYLPFAFGTPAVYPSSHRRLPPSLERDFIVLPRICRFTLLALPHPRFASSHSPRLPTAFRFHTAHTRFYRTRCTPSAARCRDAFCHHCGVALLHTTPTPCPTRARMPLLPDGVAKTAPPP